MNKFLYERAFSAAVVVTSRGDQVFHRAAYGSLSFPPPLDKTALDALFDLGSLSVPLGSGLLALHLCSRSRLDLGAPLGRTLQEFQYSAPAEVTVDMLLDHTSGLPARRDLHGQIASHDATVPRHEAVIGTAEAPLYMRAAVAGLRPDADPGTACILSEVGPLALGWDTPTVNGPLCSGRFSRNAVGFGDGHCFVWVDLAADTIGVVLTKRGPVGPARGGRPGFPTPGVRAHRQGGGGAMTRGFSTIELMVALAIIGILAGVALPNFMRFQAKARRAEARQNLGGIFLAKKANYSVQNSFLCGPCNYTVDGDPFYSYSFWSGAEDVPGRSGCVAVEGEQSTDSFTAVVKGNIDSDTTCDVWRVHDGESGPHLVQPHDELEN